MLRAARIPFVQQLTASECGVAALAMVLRRHGRHATLGELREAVGSGRDGTSALELVQGAACFGLSGKVLRRRGALMPATLPPAAILHWQDRHYVVLERCSEREAVVLDPASGRRTLSRESFLRSWSGVALVFEPGPDFRTSARPPSSLRRYAGELLRDWPALARVVGLSFVVQLLGLAVPALTGLLVDHVIPGGHRHFFGSLLLGFAGVIAASAAVTIGRARLLLALRTRLDSRMTRAFVDHLLSLPFPFFERRSTGDLLMRLNSNATIREILTTAALSGMLDGVVILIYLGALFYLAPGFGMVVALLGLVQVAAFLVKRGRDRELLGESLQAQANLQSCETQMLGGIMTLKAMGVEQHAAQIWASRFADVLEVSVRRGRLHAALEGLHAAVRLGAPLVLLAYGADRVMAGALSLGTMLGVYAVGVAFLSQLAVLVTNARQLQYLGTYLERVDDVLQAPRAQESAELVPAPELRGEIRLERVTLRYTRQAQPALRDVSLSIPAGSCVAVVGASGAGKSSLASVLVGLYPASEGGVWLDGQPLDRLERQSVLRQVGVVLQAPALFWGSVRDNICAGRQLADEDVIAAAKIAQLHDELEAMPMGYDTLLGDGGSSLSGGQRQRLALARALAHRPRILILDEATSALDTAIEARIKAALDRLGCTRVVIAHRLSTVVDAQQIIVLDRGQLCESGTHDQLLALGGRYAAFWRGEGEVGAVSTSSGSAFAS